MKTILDKETRRAMRDSVGEYGVEGLITPEAFVVLLDYVDTLEAALRNCMDMLEELDGLDWCEEGMPFTIDWDDLNPILTRAKSPAPVGITGSVVELAKHSGSVVGLPPVTPQHYFTAPAKHSDTVLTPAQFLEAVSKLGEENGYSLGHEDRHGAFLVEDFNPSHKEWLLSALDQTRKQGGAR